ncbi:hypothetical protein AB1A81_10815 [Bdellovibrio bacteriovorus]|uniref:Uncharacterized protein n=1 Tax=Bdellovibrio bacteriovorus (strain ATCC 15356 / DSM 50701 / NCIMB 9529 / HD100) TaxID=264462 RepID=Q6MKM9_BDEBA|nr:hypothetical protein [Bdellovibrio bacteriovorus]AHZ84886.1 hypothetical protein EP01_08045 [Bdellovibrio bacteriovorus]BEV68773.1 hypothetical protein Bb109J_c2193 [Bdellovibrio bacteriovorus]CAE80178.1 hypothetical protein predicted by Glimmer/Critica [Bdellovibrio bacteriovorus HD100]
MFKKALALSLVFSCLAPFAQAQEREESMVMSVGDTLRRNWNFTLFNVVSQANMKPGKEQTDGRSQDSYTYISMNYKVNADEKASLRVPFIFNTAGQNEYGDQVKSETMLSDVHLVYSMYDLGYIGDIDLSGNAKVYLPTSEFSQDSGLIAKFRAELYLEYSIGRFSSISYGIKPDYYWQSRTASFNYDMPQFDDGNYVSDPRQANKQASLEHFLEVVADINKYFSFKPRIGIEEDWYHSSTIEGIEPRHVTKAFYQISLGIRPVRGISFLVGATNTTTLNSYRGKDIAFGQPENTQYFVMTNAFLF